MGLRELGIVHCSTKNDQTILIFIVLLDLFYFQPFDPVRLGFVT